MPAAPIRHAGSAERDGAAGPDRDAADRRDAPRSWACRPMTEGLAVTEVDPASEAYTKGLREGDVITEAGQQKVVRLKDLRRPHDRGARMRGASRLLLLIRRDGDPRFVALSIEEMQGFRMLRNRNRFCAQDMRPFGQRAAGQPAALCAFCKIRRCFTQPQIGRDEAQIARRRQRQYRAVKAARFLKPADRLARGRVQLAGHRRQVDSPAPSARVAGWRRNRRSSPRGRGCGTRRRAGPARSSAG